MIKSLILVNYISNSILEKRPLKTDYVMRNLIVKFVLKVKKQ